MIDGTNVLKVPLVETHKLSMKLIDALQTETIGNSLLACALTMARLYNPSERLSEEKEIKFVQDLMDWANVYWEIGDVKES